MSRRNSLLTLLAGTCCVVSASLHQSTWLAADDASAGAANQTIRERLKERLAEKKAAGADSAKPGVPGDAAEAKLTAGSQNRTLEHGGAKHSYRLYLPLRKDSKPVPTVIVLHGLGADGPITETLSGFSKIAEKHGFAAAYPSGDNRAWRYWEGAAAKKLAKSRSDDIGFLTALIDQLVKDGVADAARVYVCGISMGAYMSNRLAIDLNDKIAAIGLVSGTMPKAMSERLKPKRPMPVIYFHGTADKIVGFDGKDGFSKQGLSLSADDMAAWWAKQNGCVEKPKVEKLPDTAEDGTTVERRTFAAGKAGAPVVFYKIEGGGHTWPGGSVQPERMLGKTCRDIDASALMWEFFSQFRVAENKEGK